MQTLFQAIPVILQKAGDDPQVREQLAIAVWRKVAGDGVVRLSTPLDLQGQTLRIAVSDPTWKVQLEKIAPEYVGRMARLIGSPIVTRIEFVVDQSAVRDARPAEETPFDFQHTPEIVEELRAAAGSIRDERLREIFLQAAARSIERKAGKL
ncbi:MAG: DciA family protein [Blastocatellia bacterium]|jgi:hypothetical protein